MLRQDNRFNSKCMAPISSYIGVYDDVIIISSFESFNIQVPCNIEYSKRITQSILFHIHSIFITLLSSAFSRFL